MKLSERNEKTGAEALAWDATASVAAACADLRFEDLPAEVVNSTKTVILDGIASLVAGVDDPLAVIVRKYVTQMGGRHEATVMCTSERTNSVNAAFANGVTLHGTDFEAQGYLPAHGTSSILPAILALGERDAIDGPTVLTSFVVGWELQGRLRNASARANLGGFHPPGIYGPLAAAAAASHVLRFGPTRTAHALGIAASSTGGLFANVGSMVKATHPGNAARTGVEAAVLVQLGFESCPNIFEARNGYVPTFFADAFDWQTLTAGWGADFQIINPGFHLKRYPVQIHLQWLIEAVMRLRSQHNLRLADVDHLTIVLPEGLAGLSRPAPRTGLEGKFSAQYCAAVALVMDDVGLESFTDAVATNEVVVSALSRIELVTDRDRSRDVSKIAVLARAHLMSGSTVEEECRHYRGSPGNPMTHEEHLQKVRSCLATRYDTAHGLEIIRMVEALETSTDVGELARLLM